MCTGKCSRIIAYTLYPMVLLSIICNIVLFFPDLSAKYVKEQHITGEVMYMGGLIGGGLLVFMSALSIHLTGEHGCCANRLGMFLSILFAALGAAGAVYSFIAAFLGLTNGPLCKSETGDWQRHFQSSNMTYLTDYKSWAKCSEPKNVVLFNTALFMTLLIASCLQGLLCAMQIINGLAGTLFGTCDKKEHA
ncbi:transmembrane 4 L6 family member 1-like [Neolamprologus brichardi]|uniref:transmembrane 4 L6 family member 1-like n=1 Tax=Neolamprologus brichardi TaxID=32507 RepID=UPI0003EC279C|nr:transmembrane 4 L6 family member 1-like [Neolamprologus brichardi]